jgi:hypothetical protein
MLPHSKLPASAPVRLAVVEAVKCNGKYSVQCKYSVTA